MNDEQFVAKEQAKCEHRLKVKLERVRNYGLIQSKLWVETLLLADYVIFSSPRDGFLYNHYRLTAKGEAELQRLHTICPVCGKPTLKHVGFRNCDNGGVTYQT